MGKEFYKIANTITSESKNGSASQIWIINNAMLF